ncbi:GNAT family N-acetyltransferase [Lysinibacillus xylanilyticus]|uniref:GNAT family N-acetyltransferase n=1 Tax=Lysinibacillus xylanilyticus TaxID=582475 RepID=UPI002B246593|nr:GNAT family N-acetyltransferase [Lysinibacillus xylanilyticus]MEB2301413.1 GNAT family N-acetyltransferase [Lysinibacillus xylanilyticus]
MCKVELVEFNDELIEGIGSYCLRSKKKSNGYINKNNWLNNRFEEGLKYVQVIANKKQVGFIEYTEAENSSRVVHADGYLVIHCLWVSEVGKGYGTRLINKCLEDAKKLAKKGVVVITNSTTSWAPSKEIFLKNDFQLIDTAPYDFELLVYPLSSEAEQPYFPNDWEERLKKFTNLTILRSFQCPYVEIATENIIAGANKLNIPVELIDLKDREALMELAPTPYGIFSVIYKGQLLSFHRLTIHSVIKKLRELTQ